MRSTRPPGTPLLLSVIIPVYNEIGTIKEILTVVRKQEIAGVEIEVVVVDDGSTDGTRAFLEEHPALYDRLLINPENLGKGGAVKRGLAEATGDYYTLAQERGEYNSGSRTACGLNPT